MWSMHIILSCFYLLGPPIDKDLIENVEVRLSDPMRDVLLKPYSKDEVVMALKDMQPAKSPGPDGFPALFYIRFWDVVEMRFAVWLFGSLILGVCQLK